MTYQEKKERRIERYKNLSIKNKKIAEEKSNQFHELVQSVPFGQPILIGHHSEGASRRRSRRIHDTLGQSVKAHEKAEYYEEKAEAVANNKAISSDDPEAITKLKQKIADLENGDKLAKKANAIIRSKILTKEEKIIEMKKLGLETESYARHGYNFFYNSANIRDAKKRLQILIKNSETPTTVKIYGDIKIVDNSETNRIQIFFPGIPTPEIREQLKKSSFRWTPSLSCWQAYRNLNTKYKLKELLAILNN